MPNAPEQVKQFTNQKGEAIIIRNPYPLSLPRYEVWVSRFDRAEWRRLITTDSEREARLAFEHARRIL
jgi:hypothetical protein